MSSLTSAEITDLFRRAKLSALRGYTIARGDYYAHELGGSDGSPAGLIALCQSALAGESQEAPALPSGEEGDEPKALPQHASEGKTEPASPAPPEPPPPPAAEPEPEPEEEPHDDDAETYDSWSKKKLLAAALERNLDVKASNTKAEIIAALRAADGR